MLLCVTCDNPIHLVWTITTRCRAHKVVLSLSCLLLRMYIRHDVLSSVLQSPILQRIQNTDWCITVIFILM